MSVTNDFVPFCPNDTGTNLESQGNYLVDPDRTNGNQPGVASSQLNNKALRQGTAVANAIAQYIANQTNTNLLDNGVQAQLLSQFTAGLLPIAPVVSQFLSGTGTWNATFIFFIASGNATAGATYTNNGFTYTVGQTISAGTVLYTTGNGVPSAGGGTLTKASGTGDSTISFYAYRQALYLKVKGVGGGGGGTGGGIGGGSTAGNGGNTTFGTSLIVCNGGSGASGMSTPGAGGSASLGVGPVGIALTGASGAPGCTVNSTAVNSSGGSGGVSPFGGAGAGGAVGTSPASPAVDNTGSGGGGGGAVNGGGAHYAGGGGGAGGYVDAMIFSPSASYTWAVGAEGSAGTGGDTNGANGALGFLQVVEVFQ